MRKIKNSFKILLGFFIFSCAISAQNNTTKEKATFTINETTYNYGNIPENGGLADHVFIIKNTGKKPLVITQVVASCGCTKPEWSKDPIAPGKESAIKVSYNPQGRPGQFTKTISVYCENANVVHLTIKGNVITAAADTLKQKVPILKFAELDHDFGTISEKDEFAEYTFRFKNIGTAPLTITRAQASCGCTKPEWTQAPIEPGKDGFVIVTYRTTGRIGNFNKSITIYTNEDNGFKRHKLIIKGNVIEKPSDPKVNYADTIGGVGVEQTNLMFKNFKTSGTNKKALYIKNYNREPVYLSFENIPEYITVKCPDSLKADWPGEMSIEIDGTKTTEKRGRITDVLNFTVKNSNGKVIGNEKIKATVNYLDNFDKLSPLQSVNAPKLDITNSQLEFGVVKSGFLGLGGNASKNMILKNIGKSDLILHSVSSDDTRVHLPALTGTTIKAGESLTVKVSVKAKEIKDKVDTDIYIICNDPKGPIRMIKVTAEAAK